MGARKKDKEFRRTEKLTIAFTENEKRIVKAYINKIREIDNEYHSFADLMLTFIKKDIKKRKLNLYKQLEID